MSKQTTVLRQRGGKAAATATAAAAAAPVQAVAEDELTTADKINWYLAQHVGLVFCGAGVGVLGFGYDKGWMHNTHLCLLCLLLCLIGLFFHEFRPFNAQQIMEEEQKAASAAAS